VSKPSRGGGGLEVFLKIVSSIKGTRGVQRKGVKYWGEGGGGDVMQTTQRPKKEREGMMGATQKETYPRDAA